MTKISGLEGQRSRLKPISLSLSPQKWPMRSLLYCGSYGKVLQGVPTNQVAHFGPQPLTNGEEGS